MATFSRFPNELLLEIWRHVQPDDIESFSLLSKNVHSLSSPFLQEHLELKHQFSSFNNGDLVSKTSTAGLLKEIIKNPRVASYVKNLSITSWRDHWENGGNGVNTLMAYPEASDERYYLHTPYTEKDMELFEQAAKRAEHVFGSVDVFINLMKAGYEDPIIALLLLLSNPKSLVIEMTGDNSYSLRTLWYIIKQAAEPLRDLVKVKILNDSNIGSVSPLVKAFATLPSMKHIHTEILGPLSRYRKIDLNLPARSSNVETLTFYCNFWDETREIDALEFCELIQGFKGLKTFSIESSAGIEPSCIYAALFTHGKHSLSTLILKFHGGDKRFIGSFRSFEVLKKLELDYNFLVDDRPPRRTRLAGLLPSSLEELQLHEELFPDVDGVGMNICLDPLLVGQELLDDKSTHLPDLKVVSFCNSLLAWADLYPIPGYDRAAPGFVDMQKACIAKGFRLDISES